MKEYKIGEKFELDGVELVCVKDKTRNQSCNDCHFFDSWYCTTAPCNDRDRSDGLDVHFEKVNP